MRSNVDKYQDPVTNEHLASMEPSPALVGMLGEMSQGLADECIRTMRARARGKNVALGKDAPLAGASLREGDGIPPVDIVIGARIPPRATRARALGGEFSAERGKIFVDLNAKLPPSEYEEPSFWIELAFVLAHELGHALKVHGGKVPSYADDEQDGRMFAHRYFHDDEEVHARGFALHALSLMEAVLAIMNGEDLPSTDREWLQFLGATPAFGITQHSLSNDNMRRVSLNVVKYVKRLAPDMARVIMGRGKR